MSEIQKAVYQSVKDRGYLDGYHNGQIIARNIVKLAEELSEAGELVGNMSRPFARKLFDLGGTARNLFDLGRDSGVWSGASVADEQAFKKELADVQVVLYVLAETLGFDVAQAAADKAAADVARGIRTQ